MLVIKNVVEKYLDIKKDNIPVDFDFSFVLGGSISNLYAFLAARHKMFPNYKEKGIATIQGQLVMFTSDQVRETQTFLTYFCII